MCIRVRLDGGFAHAELLDSLDAEPGVKYVVAMGSKALLQLRAEQGMKVACLLAGLDDQTEQSSSTENPTMRPEPGSRRSASSSKPKWYARKMKLPRKAHAL